MSLSTTYIPIAVVFPVVIFVESHLGRKIAFSLLS